MDPTALFRALSDETRLRCLALIRARREVCVCDFSGALGLAQPKVSRHLAYLRSNGVVKDRRVRTMVFYRFSEKMPVWAREVLEKTLTNICKQDPFCNDLQRLADINCRSVELASEQTPAPADSSLLQ
jgi:ArsR family transcriptional regulator